MSYQVCVDASLVLLWFLPTQQAHQADTLLEKWIGEGIDLIGPPLLDAEITSVIRLHVYTNKILPDEGEEVFSAYSGLAIKIVNPDGLSTRAWELAKEYNRPRTYDMYYVAAAELEDCELWTADKRLINSLKGKNKRLHYL
jgi:predicted nucleic acid-binding protein